MRDKHSQAYIQHHDRLSAKCHIQSVPSFSTRIFRDSSSTKKLCKFITYGQLISDRVESKVCDCRQQKIGLLFQVIASCMQLSAIQCKFCSSKANTQGRQMTSMAIKNWHSIMQCYHQQKCIQLNHSKAFSRGLYRTVYCSIQYLFAKLLVFSQKRRQM